MRKHSFSFLVVMLAAGALATTASAQGRLIGSVADDEGNPLVGATVVVENPDANPPRFEQSTDDDGRFSLIGLVAGQWTVTAEAEGFYPFTSTITTRFGTNAPMALELDRVLHPLVVALGEEVFEGLDPAAVQAEFDSADAAYNAEQWEQAVTGYRSLLTQLPMMNGLHMNIGSAQSRLGQYEEAIASYEIALAGDATLETDVQTAIARTRLAMGDFDAVGSALAAAAASDSTTREDLYNLGELAFAKGDIDEAAEWYEKAAAADPSWARPLFKLALVALNKGDMETAKGFFSQVVEKDPNSEEGAQSQATLDALP